MINGNNEAAYFGKDQPTTPRCHYLSPGNPGVALFTWRLFRAPASDAAHDRGKGHPRGERGVEPPHVSDAQFSPAGK